MFLFLIEFFYFHFEIAILSEGHVIKIVDSSVSSHTNDSLIVCDPLNGKSITILFVRLSPENNIVKSNGCQIA